ncbi:MAG TPA: hypothetical protein PKH10_08050 [bacterium]|nr:hypothetical protein [bacterium]
MSRAALLSGILLFFRVAMATIRFGDQFPEELMSALATDPRTAAVTEDMTLEVTPDGFILIISDEGIMRRLPVANTTADDVLNVIETMREEITVIRKAREQKSEPPKAEKAPPEVEAPKKTEEPKKEEKPVVEWFAFADPDSRFYIGLTLSPEEAGAGGIEFSGGVAFLRFGLNAKKGLNVKLAGAPSLEWEAYGVLAQIDVLRVTEVTFSTGLEVFLYRLNNRIFERDQLFIGVAYKFLFMVVGVRAAVSPSDIVIQTEGKSYRTDQVRGVFFFSFAF